MASEAPADEAPAESDGPSATGIRVIWEALTIERDHLENPRVGIRRASALAADQKIVLVSQSHPSARARQGGKAASRDKDGAKLAVLSDSDMQLFVRGLTQIGFDSVAQSTDLVAPQFDSDGARGRVTVESKGTSRTVLFLRGQGTQDATKDIPRIYSEAKQAVAALRNRTPTLSVSTAGSEPVRPVLKPHARHGTSRVLTEEEAAAALGGEMPVAPEPEASR